VAELFVVDGRFGGTVFLLSGEQSVVGRSPECEVSISEPWVSSRHALLAQRGDWDGVIQRWTRYLELEPLNGQAYLERGGAYRHKGGQQSAIADARKACELGNRDACGIIGDATARQ